MMDLSSMSQVSTLVAVPARTPSPSPAADAPAPASDTVKDGSGNPNPGSNPGDIPGSVEGRHQIADHGLDFLRIVGTTALHANDEADGAHLWIGLDQGPEPARSTPNEDVPARPRTTLLDGGLGRDLADPVLQDPGGQHHGSPFIRRSRSLVWKSAGISLALFHPKTMDSRLASS